jgi:putative restriction endonuclease
LLVASHIIPWSIDKKNRLNPHNGLCLNSIHDRAFDCGYITISTDYKVKLSKLFNNFNKEHSINEFFIKYENELILLPDKFLPSKTFLSYHNKYIFKK